MRATIGLYIDYIERNRMTDYQKMYAILCRAVDEVINPLQKIPMAMPEVKKLRDALLAAEEIFIETADDE